MSTTSSATNSGHSNVRVRRGNKVSAKPGGSAASTLKRVAGVSALLQTTLELDELIALFGREAKATVACDGIVYSNPAGGEEIRVGRSARQTLCYFAQLGDCQLGELKFMRRRRYSDVEAQLLHGLVRELVYPLRNALMYRNAVRSAQRDPLTGVGNRAALELGLQREVDLALRHRTPLSVLILDLDHFKRINDRFGHLAGDTGLRAFAQCVAQTARRSDAFFRYGGEEFVLLLTNTGSEGARRLAERIRRDADRISIPCGPDRFGLTVSIGVAALRPTDDPCSLFKRADQALYRAKRKGRNRVEEEGSESDF